MKPERKEEKKPHNEIKEKEHHHKDKQSWPAKKDGCGPCSTNK